MHEDDKTPQLDPDQIPDQSSDQPDIDFSADFPAKTYERLRAQPGEEDDEDIGVVWEEQAEISRMEMLRHRARDAYGKALPVWKRTMYKTANFLHEAATKDNPANPDPTKPIDPTVPPATLDQLANPQPSTSLPINDITAPTAPATDNKKVTVEIKLQVPKIPRIPKERIPTKEQAIQYAKDLYARTPKHIKLTVAGVAGSLVLALVVYAVITGAVKSDPTIAESNNGVSKDAVMQKAKVKKETPSFQTLLPAGEKIDSLGGWYRISPPDRDPVYAYADKIGSANISISQQKIPDKNKNDPDGFVAGLAAGYKATERIHTEDTTLYIGHASDESQTVMFTKQKLLIFIRSSAAVTSDQWIGYVSSME